MGCDVVGGFFALNGGAFDGPPGNVFYFAPDALKWEDTKGGYTAFLAWVITGDLELFYKGSRWQGWQQDVAKLKGDQGISVYPFLWAAQGGSIEKRSRRPVPMKELWGSQMEMRRQAVHE